MMVQIEAEKKEAMSLALHEIVQMTEFATRATENLGGVGDNQNFQMLAVDANLLDFAILDILKRAKALKDQFDDGFKRCA